MYFNGNFYIGNFAGGGGYTTTKLGVSVAPGQVIPVFVGSGSTVGGRNGGFSFISFDDGTHITAFGGYGWFSGSSESTQWEGGDGGGGGGYWRDGGFDYSTKGGNGGSDGSNGENGYFNGGKGQGTTTRYFGESNGTLYAGGGGGGGAFDKNEKGEADAWWNYSNPNFKQPSGGAGGGGHGGGQYLMNSTQFNSDIWCGENGQANTGGGGGGCGRDTLYIGTSGNGGSGIAIIRWGK